MGDFCYNPTPLLRIYGIPHRKYEFNVTSESLCGNFKYYMKSTRRKHWTCGFLLLHFFIFSTSRGDVLIQPGLLVVTWWEVFGICWIQWHPGAQYWVPLVWRGPVPQHYFNSLSQGGSLFLSRPLLYYGLPGSSFMLCFVAARYSQPGCEAVCCGHWQHHNSHRSCCSRLIQINVIQDL